MSFAREVETVLNDISKLLIDKNKKYGNSALEPVRIFSKANSIEQLLVRIDDKISRLKNTQVNEDEDVLFDLVGYLVLLLIANKNNKGE